MKILIRLLLLVSALSLVACASSGPIVRAQSYEGRSEKALLAVLRSVKADDGQRTAILAAYDRHNPVLTRLADDSDQINVEWQALDRRAADFTGKAGGLAQRRQQLAAQQLVEGAAFEVAVATVLTPAQWTDWQELWDLVAAPDDRCGPGGMGPGRRRR